MESGGGDFGAGLHEVVSLLDSPASVGDRVVGMIGRGGGRSETVDGDLERGVVLLVVRVYVVRLGLPRKDSSVSTDGVDLRRLSANVEKRYEKTNGFVIGRKVGVEYGVAVSSERLGSVSLHRVERIQSTGHVLGRREKESERNREFWLRRSFELRTSNRRSR